MEKTDAAATFEPLFDVPPRQEAGTASVGRDGNGALTLRISGRKDPESGKALPDEFFALTGGEYEDLLSEASDAGKIGFFRMLKLKRLAGERKSNGRKIVSVQSFTMTLTGMRFQKEYELCTKDGMAFLSLYLPVCAEGERSRRLEKSTEFPEDEALGLLNGCGLLSWDGFYGKHPKNVKDGTMFRLEAVLNGDRTVSAHGSQNFPAHFYELREGLDRLLAGDGSGKKD